MLSFRTLHLPKAKPGHLVKSAVIPKGFTNPGGGGGGGAVISKGFTNPGGGGVASISMDLADVLPGTPIWKGQGCSSEILNLTPKRDQSGHDRSLCRPLKE